MKNVIAQLETKKAQVREKAESICRSIDETIEVFKADPTQPEPPELPKTKQPRLKPKRKRIIRQAPNRSDAAGPAKSGIANSPRIIGAARRMPEPLTVSVLSASGLFTDAKQASNVLYRWRGWGWVVNDGNGWVRTSRFGEQSDPSASSQETLNNLKREAVAV